MSCGEGRAWSAGAMEGMDRRRIFKGKYIDLQNSFIIKNIFFLL